MIRVLASLVAATLLLAGAAPAAEVTPDVLLIVSEDNRRPNVLFLASDDLRCTLGCYGDPIAVTPSLDRLAASGMLFERAYSQQAVCNPSRAALLTGLRPDSLRVWNLTTFYRDTRPDAVTLPELFKGHGYHTEQIGKIHHGSKKPSVDPKSWSVPQVMHHSAKRDQYQLEANRKGGKAAAAERAVSADDDHIDGRVAAAGVAAIRRLAGAGKPFFLAVGFRKPHLPFAAPARYWDLYDRARFVLPSDSPPRLVPDIALHNWKELRGYTDIAREGPVGEEKRRELWHGYYAATSFMDRQVGRLLEALDETGLRDDTIVVFWSDHGVHLSEHSLWAKTSNFELDARVPLIVRFPGRGAPGGKSRALVELVDLYPTLAEACGLDLQHSLEGTSFLPLLGDPSRPWKKAAFTQHPRPAYYRGEEPEVMGYSMRTDRYRYTQWRRFGSDVVVAEELYDHREDPGERVNLATERPAEVQRLKGLMKAGWRGAVPD